MKRISIGTVIIFFSLLIPASALFAQAEVPGVTTVSPAVTAAGGHVSVAAPAVYDDKSQRLEMRLQAFVNVTTNEPVPLDSIDGGWVVIAEADKGIDDGSGTIRFDLDTTGWAAGDWSIRALAGGYVYVPAALHIGQ